MLVEPEATHPPFSVLLIHKTSLFALAALVCIVCDAHSS